MDCTEFDDSLLDALYDELDESRRAEFEAHAADHPECGAKLASLRGVRKAVGDSLLVPVPPSLEERVLDAAKPTTKGGKIFAFLARPQFAIAAAFLIILGASLFLTTAKRSTPSAASAPMSDESPGAAPETASAAPIVVGQAAPPPMPTEIAPAPVAPPATLALNDQPSPPSADENSKKYAPRPAPGAAHAGAAAATKTGGPLLGAEQAFAEGRYSDARAMYDAVAKANPGTPLGSRAAFGVARCNERLGNRAQATAQYQALEADGNVADDAKRALRRLDVPPKVKAAKPAATATGNIDVRE